jgi:hypothetical protein
MGVGGMKYRAYSQKDLSLGSDLKIDFSGGRSVIHKEVGPVLIADELMSEWVNASMSYCVIV